MLVCIFNHTSTRHYTDTQTHGHTDTRPHGRVYECGSTCWRVSTYAWSCACIILRTRSCIHKCFRTSHITYHANIIYTPHNICRLPLARTAAPRARNDAGSSYAAANLWLFGVYALSPTHHDHCAQQVIKRVYLIECFITNDLFDALTYPIHLLRTKVYRRAQK